ncbi:MAG TPA: tyrosine-type recombinase/integrase, partial [Acidimicrobiia bacterium]
ARRDIAVITTPDLIAIDDAMDWPSRKTRLNALIPLRQVFRYAVSRGYRPDNPASSLHGKREAERAGPDPYTADERDALLQWLRENGRKPSWEYFTLAFYTGMRTGELIGLEWRDLQGDAIMVERAYVRRESGPTKTGKRRRVWLLPQAAEVLKSMPRPIQGGRIFVNQYGRGFQSGYHLNRSWRWAHEATGVRLRTRAYPWRHTFASLALTAGVRPALVAEQLGHSLQMLLSTYARWIPADDDRAELAKMVAADPKRTQFR